MILVTGAAGKTGSAVIRTLAAQEKSVRALVRRHEQVQPIKELGAQEVVVGDVRSQATVNQAVRGVRAIYHICPNMSPDEVSIGQAVITAARASGVEHFVYHSVLHPQTEAMPHHWQKLRVEEQLFEAGLPCTILQPAAYMQNIAAHWDQILEQGRYLVPYAVETRLSMVDLEDVAAAATVVLTQPGHAGATYELAGAEVLTQTEVAAVLSRQLGRPVQAETMSLETWKQGVRGAGLGDYQIETLIKMFRYYDRYGFWGNPHILTWLLGHPPATLADFVKRTAQQRPG
ncbi:MAG: NAD(P)-dependent oxidoreductase [Chloroflexota bacterium]|nr:MAG: NAD(P)-dependent oxidoreductase [Chloroflexota bacterium]